MAEKKKIILEETGHEMAESRSKEAEGGIEDWRSWLRSTYARYWYAFLCLFLDVMLGLELTRLFEPHNLQVLILPFLAVAVFLEYLAYRRLWPRKGLQPG